MSKTTDFQSVEILLVEDDPNDAELTLRGLRRKNLANNVTWVKDGAQALDFIFRRGAYAGRLDDQPRLILLDLKLPKVDGSAAPDQSRRTGQGHTGRGAHLFG